MKIVRSARSGTASRVTRVVTAGTTALLLAFAGANPAQASRPKASNGKACTVLGTNGNDHLIGTHGYDVICGLGGNDVITGGGGKDVLDGGAGDDQITGGTGTDTVFAGDGQDTVAGGGGNDQIRGGEGTDTLNGGGGADVVDGGPGDDTVGGGTPQDETDPANAADRLVGGEGADTLTGGPGADVIKGGDGNDDVDGGDGNDVAGGDSGDDTVAGGDGNDRLDGGADTDTLDGGAGSDGVNGGAGDDEMIGGAGDDTVNGGAGTDHAAGGDGSDRLNGGPGVDTMEGGAGNDQVSGGAGNDVITGGDGDDTLIGGDGDDTIGGGDGSDRIEGGGGSDDLDGGGGNDDMDGGLGDDKMDGGAGDDAVEGGPGVNVCVNDPDDAGGDRCTDKGSPRLDTASLTWSIEPSVSNAENVTVRLRGRLTDDRSGVVNTGIYFRSPEDWGPSLYLSSWYGGLAGGELHDGIFEYTGTLPALAVPGEWTIDSISLSDRVHRTSNYYRQEDGTFRVDTSVEGDDEQPVNVEVPPLVVTGETYDREHPVPNGAEAVWMTATTQDNSELREVKLRVPVTDDLSGVAYAAVVLRSTDPEGPTIWLSHAEKVEGDDTDGVWEVGGALPAYLPTGEWRVENIYATDRTGRYIYATPSEGGEWIEPLTITGSASDALSPTIDVSWGEYVGLTEADNSADREVRLKIRAADDVSGVQYISADYCTAGARTWMSSQGEGVDGVWELVGTLPATTTPGDWRLCSVTVTDRAGRSRQYQISADGSYSIDGVPQDGTVGIPTFLLKPVGS
ncbi:hypothetical protein [Actinoplanes sp. GCM10030250]|uniref:calcium-binding protein n=1 Tax=Actinoplanes sp. GCM10030250 TaxID=3273376 RepID=UPI003607CCBA